MVSITLSVPKDLKEEMDLFPEINWSAVAREAIRNRLLMMEKFIQFTKNSTVTEKEAIKLGRKLSAKVRKRHNT